MNIQTLVQGFAKNIKNLTASDYKESQVRLHYLDPFWALLGWDVSNSAQRAPQDAEVLVEPSMDSVEDEGLRSRAPDYLFRVSGFPRFIVEAKKPAVDIGTDKKAIFQAKRYAWNATIPFAILTNFQQFQLYNTTLKPILNEPDRGLVKDFVINFQDYPVKWEEIVAHFGRDAVAGGALEKLLAKVKNLPPNRRVRAFDRMLFEMKGDEPVDRVFLDYLEKYRQHLAQAIYHDNKKDFPEADTLHGAARLTEAVQRLIDRLVFMRVCEDRGVRGWGTLLETLDRIGSEGGELYPSLCANFRDLDNQYNGYLFKYHFSESLAVSNQVLADFVRNLYPPNAPWDFSAIGDDILGIVYERFLGNVVTVKQNNAVVEEKPEVRHAGGVYYTPRFIVDTIIRRVIGPKIADKTPGQLLELKILDPACGSGSFLVATFQYLIDHSLAAITADPALASVRAGPKARKKRKDLAFKDKAGRWHLAPDFKAALLTNCLHGVDIDQQAVEVTIMSLYLKMLEGTLPANWQRDWVENQLLPPLENNILCGNSLIDNSDFDRFLLTQGGLFPEDEDIRFRINRFDWDSRLRGFGRLLDAQSRQDRGRAGFDCILGNPPYIRVQELNQWAPDECAFYKWRYQSAKKGNYDIYVVFAERCLELLAPDGLLGFIMPHKFWQAKYGEGVRQLFTAGKHLRGVVDFGDQQVFRGATTYTAVHIFGKQPLTNGIDYAKVLHLEDGRSQCATLDEGKPAPGTERFVAPQQQGATPWVFSNVATAEWLNAIRGQNKTLAEISQKIAQGLVTSSDEVYFLHREGSRYRSDATGKKYDLEHQVVHPVLKGSLHMKRWLPLETDRAVVFPYEKQEGVWRLIPAKRFADKFPATWNYLKENRKKLEARESGKMIGQTDWYGFIYPKNLDVMAQPKILVPAIATAAEYCLDKTGKYYYVGSGGGGGGGHAIITKKLDLHYLCGLLNSKCLDAFLKRVTTPFHSGWFAYSKAYIAQIPIKLPETVEDKKLGDRIVESVREVMDAKAKLRSHKLSDRERNTLEGQVERHEHRIDEAVFRLYGVKGLPD